MPKNKKVAIVILNWNGAKLFDTFLPSVINNSIIPDVEIIVADNGSTDESINHLKSNFPTIKIMILEKNYGFAEGYNKALQQIGAEYFVLLNSDVEVSPGWLEAPLKIMEEQKTVAAVQPKILSYKKPHQFEYAGAAGGFIDKFGYPFCRGRILNRMEADLGQFNKSTPIFWASGACMFVKAEAFRKAGGFDGDFWAHMEEIDLCWRLKNKGYKIMYEPGSVVFHLGGGTLSYDNPQKVYLNFRNNLLMLYKNLDKYHFHRILLARLVLDGVAAIKFLGGFHLHNFWAVLKAHLYFYRHLGILAQKRKKLKSKNKIKNHPEIYPKSIMWKFFIQKKRHYSDLDFNPEK